MDNSTQIVSFILVPYVKIGHLRHLYFTALILAYLLIICVNTLLIGVICMERTLHEPMYLFLCSLFVCELYGSTAVFPCMITHMLSDSHEVSFTVCFLQLFCLYFYGTVEYLNLAVMAYDRYVSICYPLHYSVIMNTGKVCRILTLLWIYSLVKCGLNMVFTVNMKFCGNLIDKVYCDPKKVACSTATGNSTYMFISGIMTFSLPLIPISFSYVKILTVCLKNSKEVRQKAIKTCTPHIVSLTNFAIGSIFEVLPTKVNMAQVPNTLRVLLSVYLVMCQPLLNPVLYGLNLTKIRNVCREVLLYRMLNVSLREKTFW